MVFAQFAAPQPRSFFCRKSLRNREFSTKIFPCLVGLKLIHNEYLIFLFGIQVLLEYCYSIDGEARDIKSLWC